MHIYTYIIQARTFIQCSIRSTIRIHHSRRLLLSIGLTGSATSVLRDCTLGRRGLPSCKDKVPLMSICRFMSGSLSRMHTASSTMSFFLLVHFAIIEVFSTNMLRVSRVLWFVWVCLSGAPFCKCIVMRRDSVVVV